MNILRILKYVTIVLGLLPLVTAVINYKNLNHTLKLAAVFFALSFLIDTLSIFVKHFNMANNYPMFQFFNIICILFFGIIYYQSFYNKYIKILTLIMTNIAMLMVIFYTVKNSIWAYPSASNTVVSVFLILISLIYFYQLLNWQEFTHIERQPLFWINSGVLIYFSINIFLFMLYNKLQDKNYYYVINSVTNIITNLLFAIGLFCKPRKRI
ncbi:MAG: hypothetical protein EOP43_02625 [Sphingobacteriaceae bacterium]|nr:MAG: hypothetical protein EOP43_02625 [Sphingobacteriaceae bacterium]